MGSQKAITSLHIRIIHLNVFNILIKTYPRNQLSPNHTMRPPSFVVNWLFKFLYIFFHPIWSRHTPRRQPESQKKHTDEPTHSADMSARLFIILAYRVGGTNATILSGLLAAKRSFRASGPKVVGTSR